MCSKDSSCSPFLPKKLGYCWPQLFWRFSKKNHLPIKVRIMDCRTKLVLVEKVKKTTIQHNTTQHSITQCNAKSVAKIVPGSSIAPEGWGLKVGGNATSSPHSRGSPNKGRQNQNWLPHPCLLGGPKEGGSATSLLHSRGSPSKGIKSELAASPIRVGIGNSPQKMPYALTLPLYKLYTMPSSDCGKMSG